MPPRKIPAGEYVPTADQRVVIYNVPWEHYEEQLRLRGEGSVPRISYLDGALELLTPSRDHERIKSFISRLVETYALEVGIDLSPYGQWTLKKQPDLAGAEPDECYIVGEDQSPEIPHLVIEVVWTHGSINKPEIYRRMGVSEMWRWASGKIEILVLQGGRYESSRRSAVFPGLDVELLTSFLECPTVTQAIRAFQEALRTGKPRSPSRRRLPRTK